MFSYLSSFFSPSQPSSAPEASEFTPPQTSPVQLPTNPAHTERNRKKRLAKKKSKQRRRQSTMTGHGSDGDGDDDPEDDLRDDEAFPDADDDLSYIPLEPDNTPSTNASAKAGPPRIQPKPGQVQPSQIPPQEVMAAVSRLPPLLPNGEKLPNDERAKRIIASQGFVPVEDQDGGLHVGVKVRTGVVAVMGNEGPLLFQM
ncbi:hypothetical protein JCM16303_000026 [Sporobolomyces ruberrimus]